MTAALAGGLEAAIQAHRAGDYELARTYLMKCLAGVPDDPATLRHLAILAGETGELELAITHLRRLAALRPDDGDCWYRLSRISRADDHSAGLEPAKRALALMPADFESWRNLALIHRQNEQWHLAAAAFGRASTCGADSGTAGLQADMLEQAGDISGALAVLSRATRMAPPPAPLCLKYARLLKTSQALDQSWLWAKRALALRPAHAETIALAIDLLRQLSQPDIADRYLARHRNLLS